MNHPLDAFDLRGRTALVTGARREIGRAIALALAAQGARLAVHHAGGDGETHAGGEGKTHAGGDGETQDARGVVDEIRAGGGKAEAFACDFAADDAGTRLAREVLAEFGCIDILVLNASIEIPEDYRAVDRGHFDRQIAVNLRTTLELLQALVPPMASRGWGRVVAIGSVQQELPHPQMMVYAGTKAAQANWIRSIARQFGGHGVTANNLAPGAIHTARNREQMVREGEAILQRIPAGRLGRPDDLVGAALLLCSDAGSYINGSNLYVDGGRHVGR